MAGTVTVIPADGALKIESGAKVLGPTNGQAAGIASVASASGGDAPTEAEFNAVVAAVNSMLTVMRNLGMIANAPG